MQARKGNGALQVRVSDDHRAAIAETASDYGWTVSQMVRWALAASFPERLGCLDPDAAEAGPVIVQGERLLAAQRDAPAARARAIRREQKKRRKRR